MKKALILILFYTILINAQSLELGFDIEAHQIRISDQYGEKEILGGNGLPVAIHFVVTYNHIDRIAIQSKIGRTFHLEFFGWEFGIKGNYKFYSPFYITAGILHHSNEGRMIQSNSYDSEYASILMMHLGTGVDISSIMSVEFNYYLPTSKKIIGGGYNSSSSQFISNTFEHMFRLSFIWGWEL